MPRARKSCPYNPGCHCYKADCERCGFYPPVEEQRKLRLMNFKKWKVPLIGHCEVWAKSPEEAIKKADNDEIFFIEYNFGDPIAEDEEESE